MTPRTYQTVVATVTPAQSGFSLRGDDAVDRIAATIIDAAAGCGLRAFFRLPAIGEPLRSLTMEAPARDGSPVPETAARALRDRLLALPWVGTVTLAGVDDLTPPSR
jgi:hypothetical protein